MHCGDSISTRCSWLVFLPFTEFEPKIAVDEWSMAPFDEGFECYGLLASLRNRSVLPILFEILILRNSYGETSNTVPQPPSHPVPLPPSSVVPYRLPAESRAKVPYGASTTS